VDRVLGRLRPGPGPGARARDMVAENRQHPRSAFQADVTFQAGHAGDSPRVAARCRDVSLGGMFIETDAPLPYGSALRVYLALPGLKGETVIGAVVRWAAPEGMGVQFGTMGARETHALTRLLAPPR
jgi:hypothetical protein